MRRKRPQIEGKALDLQGLWTAPCFLSRIEPFLRLSRSRSPRARTVGDRRGWLASLGRGWSPPFCPIAGASLCWPCKGSAVMSLPSKTGRPSRRQSGQARRCFSQRRANGSRAPREGTRPTGNGSAPRQSPCPLATSHFRQPRAPRTLPPSVGRVPPRGAPHRPATTNLLKLPLREDAPPISLPQNPRSGGGWDFQSKEKGN